MARPVCSVLAEMRTCIKTADYKHFFNLVEEAKEMTMRMAESAVKEMEDDETDS